MEIQLINSSESSNDITSTTTQITPLDDRIKVILQNDVIRKILELIHDDFRFMITRNGLGDQIEHRPSRLSIHAILNARLMNEYKEILLSRSFREKTWPIVESINQYKDITPWLLINRCPYIYNAETKKTANVYGIYRYPNGCMYDGEWRNGKFNGQGKNTWSNGEVHEGAWIDDKRNGYGKNIWFDGSIYEGWWIDSKRNGQGKYTYALGYFYEGWWIDDKRNGYGKNTWPDGEVYEGAWINDKRNGQGKCIYANGTVHEGEWIDDKYRLLDSEYTNKFPILIPILAFIFLVLAVFFGPLK